jgi:hypothetical protein
MLSANASAREDLGSAGLNCSPRGAHVPCATLRDLRSVRAQDALREHWRRVIKKRPPAARVAWLKSTEGHTAFGEDDCNRRVKEIEERQERLRARVRDTVPGGAWLNAWDVDGKLQPGLAFNPSDAIVAMSDGRRFSVRLLLSRERVRSGFDVAGEPYAVTATRGSRRWTPPQAVELEDFLDHMTPDQAAWWSMGAGDSPSAVVILRIGLAKARPIDGNW